MVDAVILEFANLVDVIELAGRPAVDVLRSGISEAIYLKSNPPESWPPEISDL